MRLVFQRSKHNPILQPGKNAWESKKVYNPAAFYENGIHHLFYRAVGKKWISSIGHAISKNGERFKKFKQPLLHPEYKYEERGTEDPRIAKIGGTYYLTYATLGSRGGKNDLVPRVALAISRDLKHWKKYGPIFKNWNFYKAGGYVTWKRNHKEPPINHEWSKAAAIFPAVINDKYWMLFGDSCIWLAFSKDGRKWQPLKNPFIRARGEKYFDQHFVEMGPAPIKTDEGWLILYHGIDKKKTYRLGYAILDANNPMKIIYRGKKPIFEPTASYELSGFVDVLPGGLRAMSKMNQKELAEFIQRAERKGTMPKVTFCNGATLVDKTLRIYYGASDSVICTARAKLRNILQYK